jgi:hypothetical protein
MPTYPPNGLERDDQDPCLSPDPRLTKTGGGRAGYLSRTDDPGAPKHLAEFAPHKVLNYALRVAEVHSRGEPVPRGPVLHAQERKQTVNVEQPKAIGEPVAIVICHLREVVEHLTTKPAWKNVFRYTH